MAIQLVEIPDFHRWAVIHTTSDTMFAPTFPEDDELNGAIFAQFYGELRSHGALSNAPLWTEEGQMKVADEIRAFLDELAPREQSVRQGDRIVPRAWAEALDGEWSGQDDDNRPNGPVFEIWQVLDAFSYGGQEHVVDFVMKSFQAWRATHQPKPKFTAYDVYACGHSYPTSALSGTVYHRRCDPCNQI